MRGLYLYAVLLLLAALCGCCGAPIAARRDAAADLREAVERFRAANEVLDKALVPHPSYDAEGVAAVLGAVAKRDKAAAEIEALAGELAGAEGAR